MNRAPSTSFDTIKQKQILEKLVFW